jgi:hypothetical protein
MRLELAVCWAVCWAVCVAAMAAGAENASTPGRVEADPPTLLCLGAMWEIGGDANHNAAIDMDYRKAGDKDWTPGYPLMRAEDGNAPDTIKQKHSYFFKVPVPPNTWRFAGSIVDLEPNTEYEMRLTLKDPDGGGAEKILKAKTRGEPPREFGGRSLHAAPEEAGKVNGDGSKDKPFRGLNAAQAAAQPGDTVFLLPGEYTGPFKVTKNGQPNKSIVWRGPKDKSAVINGGVDLNGREWLAFDSLTIRNSGKGLQANGCNEISVRWCVFEKNKVALEAGEKARNLYIADNDLGGASTWPRTKGIEPVEAIDIGGRGIVVCHNRIHNVADGISSMRNGSSVGVDFHNNDIFECTDDGIETDYAEWNIRVFDNRLTNVFQGISSQPMRGGPSYIFRNAIYNLELETFKLHNYTSGALIFNNTTVKKGQPLMVSTPERANNIHVCNNLFVGTAGGMDFGVFLDNSSCDYNAVAAEDLKQHIRWSKKNMPPLEELKKSGPVQQHGLEFKYPGAALFAADVKIPADPKVAAPISANALQLKEGSPAVDAALLLPGLNSRFKGKGPDLGAYELGAPLPHYGPRPDPAK